ncbi:MAG: TonB-dependent receptor [Elusimicrobiales bacterium]|jgi:iron complex outermembrane receptor protein
MKTQMRMLAILALLNLPQAFAKAADPAAFQFFEEEAGVITSAKRAQPLSKAAASASVISAEEIRLYGYRTLGEALQSVPGFYSTDDRSYTSLWVRGFGRPGDFNSRVLLLINGHRMNDNIYGQAFVGNEFSLDMNSISRIEIIKGPGAALYGDNAFFAVINVITKTPEHGTGTAAELSAGSYGTTREFAEVSHSYLNGLNLYAAGSNRRMQGQRLHFSEFSSVNNGHANATADAEKNYTFYLDLAVNGWDLRGNTNSRTKGLSADPFGDTFNDPRSRATDSRSFLELSKNTSLRDDLTLTARIYYDWYYYNGFFFADNAAPPPLQSVSNDTSKASWYGEEGRLQYDLGGENILTVGEEYEYNTIGLQKSRVLDPFSDNLDVNYAPSRWAIFAQQELKPADALRLTLGGRYDRYQAFGKTVNPRFAAVYDLSQDTTLKLMGGSAFKAPGPFEMFYSFPGLNKANPSLEPEKIRTYEAYCERKLPGGWGSAGAGYFLSTIDGLITQIVDPADGLPQFINKDRINTKGLELNARLRFSSLVSGHAGYTMQNTREDGGGRLSNSPRHTGSAGITGRLASGDASAGLELFVVGTRTTFQETRLRPAALLSLNLSARLWKTGPRCYLGIYNLANANYQASGTADNIQAAIGQDRRNYTVGLEHRF